MQGLDEPTVLRVVAEALASAYGDRMAIRASQPVESNGRGRLDPDLCVVPNGHATERAPTGEECVLVVEVARTEVAKARSRATGFASVGVPVYWVADLVRREVEVYEQPLPAEGRYALVRMIDEAGVLDVPGTNGGVLRVRDLFPTPI